MAVDAVLTQYDSYFDFNIDSNGDIETEDFFDTYIIVALFTDKRADSSEVPTSENRRGWIGNESTPGVEMGSKLWLYSQSRITRTLLKDIETEAIDCLNDLVNDGYADNIDASAVLSGNTIKLELPISRPNSPVDKRFYQLWENTGIR